MRLHLIGFPHTRVDDFFSTCAYSQKISKFTRMGWDNLVVYATEGSQVGDAELVECLSERERTTIFGEDDLSKPPEWPNDLQWLPFNLCAAKEVDERSEPGDLLLLAGGWSQHSVALANPNLIACEPGVGYEGVWANFAAYESYAWQHHVYAKKGWDGRWFDRVIPNYFDPCDFPYLNKRSDDYLLFVGRVVQRKGLQAASDIAKACEMRLVVAGPGPTEWEDGERIVAPEVTVEGDVHYVGTLGVDERAELMAGAYALLAPTVYVEPFGGVAVEAMMCGTPVVSTDWGAFTETVESGVTGYRFRTLQEAVEAVNMVGDLEPQEIRDRAIERYSLEAVKPQFEEWFGALLTLSGAGWYELRERLTT